ncbi:hypothetical protein A1O1_08730 [Capronia coronata CBS 617.96]|uniref:Uncharacterized protein n=1 Tax=Capronia coronata CBS 617.96 TaxID=1182541 RepID=W9YE47_9EURO|nr:uncharacterized protein A1O1_08730 [Capronia coronata CBS 617.96]EXJ80584.1 hypothetical protein A1O1_08730 [Capronia coronata CBS 617.96]
MAQDNIFWKHFYCLLKNWWYGREISSTIDAPKRPDFPPHSTDFSAAALFDANIWTEKVVVLLRPEYINSGSNQAASNDFSLIHFCLLLPTEQAIFNPICPVIQTQPHVQIQKAEPLVTVEQTTTDIAIWQDQGSPVYEPNDAPQVTSLLSTAPFACCMVLMLPLVFTVCYLSCPSPSWIGKSKRALVEIITKQDMVLKKLIETHDNEISKCQKTIKEQSGLVDRSQSLLDNAVKKLDEQQTSLGLYASKIDELKETIKELQNDLDARTKEVAEKEAATTDLKAALEQANSMQQTNNNDWIVQDQEASIKNLEESVQARNTKIEELEKAVSALKESTNSKEVKIKEQTKSLSTLNTGIKSKDNKVKELQDALIALETSSKDKDSTIKEQKTALTTLQASVKTKDATIQEHVSTLTALNLTLESKDKVTQKAKNSLTALQALGKAKDTAIKQYEKTIGELMLSVKSKDEELEQAKKALTAVESSLKGKDEEVKQAQGALATAASSVKARENKIREQKDALAALAAAKAEDVRANQAQITQLEQKVKSFEEYRLTICGLESSVEDKEATIGQQRSTLEKLEQQVKQAEEARGEEATKREKAQNSNQKVLQDELDQLKQDVKAKAESIASLQQRQQQPPRPQLQIVTDFSGQDVNAISEASSDEYRTSFAQTRIESARVMSGPIFPLAPAPVVSTFEQELESSFCNTSFELGVSPTTPRVNINFEGLPVQSGSVPESDSIPVSGPAAASAFASPSAPVAAPAATSTPASRSGSVSAVDQIYGVAKVKNQGYGPGDLMKSRYATPVTSTVSSPAPAPTPAATPVSGAASDLVPASASRSAVEHIFGVAKVKNQGYGPGDLLQSKYATPTTSTVTSLVSTPAQAPASVSTPAPVQDASSSTPSVCSSASASGSAAATASSPVAKDHIFSVAKVKNMGHGPGDLLKSRFATPPATPTAATTAAGGRPASVSVSSAASPAASASATAPYGSMSKKDDKDHIFAEPKVSNQGYGAGDLLASRYATPATTAAAASPSPSAFASAPPPAPAPPTGPRAQGDHIFSEPKVKSGGHGAGDLLASRFATATPGPASAPATPASALTIPAGPNTPTGSRTPPTGPRQSGSVSARSGSGSDSGSRHHGNISHHSPGVPGAPTRPKTKIERIIDSQAAARGLPATTPNRPKTPAGRAAEATK